jgi:eukaryotic-like serine/threonine-protein kinase
MTKEDWQVVEAAFQQAVDLPLDARGAFLAAFARERADLAPQVGKLVDAHFADDDALSKPIEAAIEAIVGEASDPWIGRAIGVWNIRERIATGGMGAVFLGARADGQFDQSVAIKIMSAQLLASDAAARFKAERQILARLNHPYIAQLYDGGTTDEDLPYLVMEYVDGQRIDHYCEENGLDVDARLELFRKVCDAVDYAHRNLTIHRDLKPSNILIDAHGNPKLLDFGIAKLLDDGAGGLPPAVTREGMRAMTPEYASPEQMRGEPVAVATDVYSLGVLLYRLMTGQSPYGLSGATPLEYERAILEQSPKRPSTIVSATSPGGAGAGFGISVRQLRHRLAGDLDNIALKALQKEPERRYPSASALAQDIGRYLRLEPVEARGDDWVYIARKFAVRNAGRLAAAGLVLVGVAAIVAFYTLQLASERDRAQLEAAKAAQVTDYLTELFGAADPTSSLGETITADTLLERGAARLDDELGDQPELRAALLKAIAASYSNMGEFQASLAQAEKALAVEAELDDIDPVDSSRTHQLLGSMLLELGEYDRSLAELEEALRLQERIGAGRSIAAGNALRYIAKNYDEKAEYERAGGIYVDAIDILRSHGAEGADSLASGLLQYGQHQRIIGEVADEERLLQESLAISEGLYGPVHPRVANTLNSLGVHYWNRGDPEQGRTYLERAIEVKRQLYGDDNISVARSLANLAQIYSQIDDHARSIELDEEALVVFQAKLGDEHPQVAFLLENIANEWLAVGDHDAAIAAYRDSESRMRRIFGVEHPEYAYTVSNVGGAFLVMGEYEEARGYLEAADRTLRGIHGDDHPNVALNEAKLAVLAMETGEYDEAVRLYRDVLDILAASFGAEHVESALNYERLGDTYVRMGSLDEAEQALRESIRQWDALGVEPNRHTWRARARLGNALALQDRYDEAEALLEPAYAWWTDNVPADDEETATVVGWYEALRASAR